MRIHWGQTLLLAANAVLLSGVLAAPCPGRRCERGIEVREEESGLHNVDIRDIPKPPPRAPKPPTRPPPKPPAPEKPQAPIVCKRAAGGSCKISPKYDENTQPVPFKAQEKGEEASDALIAAQKAKPLKDVGRASVDSVYDVTADYNVAGPMNGPGSKYLNEEGQGLSVKYEPGKTVWTHSIIQNKEKDRKTDKLDRNILDTYENAGDGTMIINDSRNQENDDLLKGPNDGSFPKGGSLPWSDMVMHNWKAAAKKGKVNPNSLKYMIRNGIGSGSSADETQELIDAAIDLMKGDRTKVNTFRGDPKASGVTENELAAYRTIAGSPHAHRVIKMLADYPETMPNVRVESFSVTTSETEAADEEYNIVIKFTHAVEEKE